jgi:hypothetical protein
MQALLAKSVARGFQQLPCDTKTSAARFDKETENGADIL